MTVNSAAPPLRVLSLLPSNTEIVCALGLTDWLVGRSHECDFPAEIRGLPACTAAAIPVDGSSAEIDREVKQALEGAMSLYRVDQEQVRRLAPEVILTQAQCDVCAVSLADVEEAVSQLAQSRPRLLSLAPRILADVWGDVRRVAEFLGVAARGIELAQQLAARVESIAGRVAGQRRPRVACLEWLDPLMSAGNWVPELVRLAGGIDPLGKVGAHSDWLTWPELIAADPEVILLMPCGFDLPRIRAELPALQLRPQWHSLRAVREGRIYLVDGNQFFNRPGPRLVESLQILVEILHPGEADSVWRHRGVDWQPLESFAAAAEPP